MAEAKKDEISENQKQSKIRGRVFSTEQPVSKIGEPVFSTDKTVSKMATLLLKQGFEPRSFARGEPVEGQIVSVLADSVLVDIGSKAEGILPIKELQETGEKPEIGKLVKALVGQPEGDSGTIILTVKKAVKEKTWEDLQEIADKNEAIDVKGMSSNRGGLIVEYKGVRGFIPSSHLVTDPRDATGRNISVKVLQVNSRFNKLVFSERETASEHLPKVELSFKTGDSLDVTVSKILPFGLLVSIPSGPDGLVHISEISWKKVGTLTNLFKIGQKLKVKVISIDVASGKVNLSMKQLEKDPWREAEKEYKVGSIFERGVSRSTSYGVFVELEDGIEGLIHSSKIPYGVEFKVGDKIKIQVDLFDSEQKRVALRLDQAETNADNDNAKSEKGKPKRKSTKSDS